MEDNRSAFSGQGNQGSQQNMGAQNSSPEYNQSGSNQDSAKFSQDNDDFSRAEDNMDGEMNLQTGYTGSETSSSMHSSESGQSEPWSDDFSGNEMSTSALGRDRDEFMSDADSDFENGGWDASSHSSGGSGSQSTYSDGSEMDMDETRNASGSDGIGGGATRSWNEGDAANGGFGQNNR